MENLWHLRRVADNAAKACWICYKPSTSVLITPSNKDFFYICPGHLSDKGFCQPEADEAKRIADQKKQDELDREIEAIKELSKTKDQNLAELGPRIYQLNKNFYQMRLDKLRNAEIAKRNRERLNNPANFPSVPSGNP
ncbi:hypothetical protein AA0116_g3262 [Alternaria tenuissima]|nr:hypothetical protein AA0116_g3262 [Alternaria tenuissima]